jgi:hypothetical protein
VAQTGEQRFSRFSFRCEKRLRHQSETRSENRLLRFSVKNGGARDGILVPMPLSENAQCARIRSAASLG